jgi:hypothetical protein
MFLLGACGETGPVEQKQADTTVTERLGRQVYNPCNMYTSRHPSPYDTPYLVAWPYYGTAPPSDTVPMMAPVLFVWLIC